MLKEEIKIIVNDVQTVETEGWMGAMNAVREISKKQYRDEWLHCEWGPQRQAKLDEMNRGRNKRISADHMLDGFRYVCKPQWKPGIPVMEHRELLQQYVFMRIFSQRGSEGVPLDADRGYAYMHAKLDGM